MTTQTVTIRYKVDASGALVATGAVVKTTQQVGQAAQGANRALAQQAAQVKSLQGLLANYTQQLRSLFGLYLTFQGVQMFSQFVDEFTNLNGRLAVTITNTNAYAQAQRDVYAISQETYTSLASTANLYARLTVALEELNSTQEEVASITRTVNQALLVSGATTAEANSAIIQLSQSFASGVLRGEEFNAVNEAGPRIMTALAKSLNVSRGALREMASEGKLTADVLRKALLDDALNIAKEAENVPLTIGRGYTSLRNDLLNFVGAMDSVYGVSSRVAEGLVYLGQNLVSISGYFATALQAAALFAGTRGLLAVASGIQKAATAGTLLSTIGIVIGGWPTIIAVAVTALVMLSNNIRFVSEAAADAADNMERFKLLLKIDPDAAARLAVENYNMLKVAVEEASAALQKQKELIDSKKFGGPTQAEFAEFDRLTLALEMVTKEFENADAAFDNFNKHAERSSRAVGGTKAAVAAFRNNQLQLIDALIASGAPLGKQIKAAQDMRNALESLRAKIDGVTYTQQDFDREQKAIIANYQREIQAINSVGAQKASDRNRTIAQASAQERLNNIIAQYSREQDDANKVLKQLEGVQREVNNILGRFPDLADEAKAALELLGRAADEARDPLRGFREEVQRLIDGNINETSAQLALLGAALEDAFNAGDTARADEIVRAMERIEQQAGLSMSAAELLREQNKELAEEAFRQADAYAQYWVDAFGSVADAIGEFVANGMKDWKSFGKSLLNTVKKIVADIVAEFIKLKVINPMLNQLLGTNLQTGGQGLLSSLFGGGGSGSANGGFGNLISSLFGGGTNSARIGINQVNVINGRVGPSGGSGGGFFSGGGMMQNGFSMGGMMGAGGGILMGLQGIRTGNALQGAAGGAMAGMSIGGPWGALIGGIIGGLGALIRGKKPPDFRFGGANANVRNPEGGFETVFGRVRAGSREISWESVVEPMQRFDQTIQQMIQSLGGGDEQLARITQALSTWSVDLRGGAATAENILGSRFEAILGTFDQHIQDFVGSAGTVEERVGRLADALAIEQFADSGELLSSFTDLAAILTTNRIGTEALTDTYARVLASTQLLESALAMSGTSLDMTRMEFIQFATDITTAAGGLERASQLWEGFFTRFYSEEERTLIAAEQARTRASAAFSEIGLDFSEFDNDTGMARFRQMFEEQLPNLSAEAIVAWLEAGNALADLVDITTSYNAVLEESVEAVTSLADLMSTVESEIAEFGGETQTFSQRIQAVNTDLEALIAQAVALGAGEKEIARIRELGVLRVNAILEEQRAALGAYSSFVGQFASSNSGLSQFQRSLQQIADESAAAAAEANRLAVAAGLTGANAEDLANIQMRAAEEMAAAALALEESIRGLAGQLDYIQEAGEGSRFPTYFTDDWFRFIQGLSTMDIPRIDSKRFDLVAQLSRQVRELSEFTGESILGVLDRMQIPFNRVIEDFGVSISALGNSEVFDRFVTASRTLGIEVSEASARLGVNVGQLADANSRLNDGFERAVSRLPAAVGVQIVGLLRNLENAVGPEAQEAARRQLSDFINAQTPAIRAALAPFLDDVDTTSVESQQLAAADQTNRYLSAANDYLQRIATNTAVPATPGGPNPRPGGPNPRPGDKATSAEKETHRLLAALLASMQNLEREQRSRNQKAVIGANNG